MMASHRGVEKGPAGKENRVGKSLRKGKNGAESHDLAGTHKRKKPSVEAKGKKGVTSRGKKKKERANLLTSLGTRSPIATS